MGCSCPNRWVRDPQKAGRDLNGHSVPLPVDLMWTGVACAVLDRSTLALKQVITKRSRGAAPSDIVLSKLCQHTMQDMDILKQWDQVLKASSRGTSVPSIVMNLGGYPMPKYIHYADCTRRLQGGTALSWNNVKIVP